MSDPNKAPATVDETVHDLFWFDRRTRGLVIGAAVAGLAIGLSGAGEGPAWAAAVRVPAYAVACACIVRFVPLVRRRIRSAFVAHQVAMVAIAGMWAVAGVPGGVVVNGAWFVSAGVWYAVAGRDT